MIDASASARPDVAPWAVRVASQFPPLTPEQITRCRTLFGAAGCPCGCTGPGDPACSTRRPIGPAVDYSQQFEYGQTSAAA